MRHAHTATMRSGVYVCAYTVYEWQSYRHANEHNANNENEVVHALCAARVSICSFHAHTQRQPATGTAIKFKFRQFVRMERSLHSLTIIIIDFFSAFFDSTQSGNQFISSCLV